MPTMTQMTSDQLVALAKELVGAAAQKNIPLRVLGGVAVLNVGAATEVEMKEKKRASKMLCMQPAQRSKKESSQAEAWLICAPSRHWIN
jgi:hypothetical protein